MNSQSLQKDYYDLYKSFFGQHTTVISMPFMINWSGDVMANYTGISIKQKIPLRLYIGISPANTGKISLENITYYEPSESSFTTTPLLCYAPYFMDVEKYLKKKYKSYIEKYKGLKITIFSELPRSMGLGFNSLVALGIVTGLKTLDGSLTENKLKKIQKQTIQSALNNEILGLRDLIYEAMELDIVISGKPSSSTKISSFFDGYYPTIAFKEDASTTISQNELGCEIFGYRLNEIVKGLDNIPYFPFDFAVVYSGKPVIIEQLTKERSTVLSWVQDAKKFFQESFSPACSQQLPIKKPKFYKNFVDTTNDPILETYGKIMGATSIEVLYCLKQLLTKDYSDATMTNFLDSLNNMYLAHRITRKNSISFTNFMSHLKKNLREFPGIMALYPNDSTIMGGTVTFVSPHETMRQSLMTAVRSIEKTHPGASLLYNSWADGLEKDGLIIEQAITQDVCSKFVPRGNRILQTYDGGIIVGEKDVLVQEAQHDVILDMVHGKIFVRGKKLTSQELHSQNATVELLSMLFSNLDTEISNKLLSASSYSKNKNEMISKIVLPLRKVVQEKLDKDLPIECSGKLSLFGVKLKKNSVRVGFLKAM
ncbi:MAG TPA: hypothetical protein PKD96_01860 [Candidatus Absconditabacterales bacterium]|nr:hypothetical protein [Candidatus Absconditabacterales bacterium]HMT27024.1 hypothetical protein [Candidatus Absconditabacterales bacterium]